MLRPELIRRYYNLITGENVEDVDDIPTKQSNLINSHSELALLSVLVLNDFELYDYVTRIWIIRKYAVSERTARTLFNKYKYIKYMRLRAVS